MTLAITGGGTGGHLSVAKSIAKIAKQNGIKLFYIGSISGQDRKYFQNSELFEETYFLNTSGVVNKKGLKKFYALFKIFGAFLISIKILKKHKTDAVFSVGGYSAAPASFASLVLNIPLYIHEQNAKTGRLNSVLKKFAEKFFSSYDDNSPVKAYPVDKVFFENARVRKDIKTIIFLGGSQGALAINNLALNVADELIKKGIKIIHQCGSYDYDRVKKEYETKGLDVDLFAFNKELYKKMVMADFAVSRSGASTLWELCANGLPALFVPYPYAAGDHQYYNAKFLVDKKLSFLAREDENPKDTLMNLLDTDLENISKKLIDITQKDGAEKILKEITNDARDS